MKPKLTTRVLKYLLITSIAIAFAIALIWIISQGYSAVWTGFGDFTKPTSDFTRGKTLWDWMQLFIIPIFLSIGAFLLNKSERDSERKRSEERAIVERQRAEERAIVERQHADERAKVEREISTDRLQETAFQSYLDRMANLLLDENLHAPENDKVHNVARILTLSVLRGLDAQRKGMVLVFLQEAGLLGNINETPVINLRGADLSGISLSGKTLSSFVDLRGASLSSVNLSGADLSHNALRGTNLSDSNLSETNFTGAGLMNANLSHAIMVKSNLTDSILVLANLDHADLTDADLSRANMNGADLTEAKVTQKQLDAIEQMKTTGELNLITMPDGTKYERQLS